jgi:hypothetical protein
LAHKLTNGHQETTPRAPAPVAVVTKWRLDSSLGAQPHLSSLRRQQFRQGGVQIVVVMAGAGQLAQGKALQFP